MKKTNFARCRFAPALLLALGLTTLATAQKTESAPPKAAGRQFNVRVIERNGDDVRETERTYHIDGMTDSERDKLVMKLVDSLKANRKTAPGQRQMTIIVDDADGNRIVTRQRNHPGPLPADAYTRRGRAPRANSGDSSSWQHEFHAHIDSLTDQMSRFKFQMPRDWDRQLARPFEEWARNIDSKPATIRGLSAYPNNPDRSQLNVRFTAPARGDVSIVVTNPKGKETARRDLSDFSGEFVGQIDLGKNAKGAYFITVTQNEDGAVKRVIEE